MMKAGTLNRLVLIEQPEGGQDSVGQPNTGGDEVASVWADVRTQGGLESIRSGAEVSTIRASIRIRYRTDITAAMRVLDVASGAVYAIRAVLPDVQTREHLDLVCEVIT